jgi:diaminobutyrate-2-oxoglutarate transaminase
MRYDNYQDYESQVSVFSKYFPTVFSSASGSYVTDCYGKKYLDFFIGACTLNYGHNHPVLKHKIIEYLQNDGITQSVDMATQTKYDFMKNFNDIILTPRKLSYKMQFTNSTGTNAVEAALKLARKVTKRNLVISFVNGYHGFSLGSMAVNGTKDCRKSGLPLTHTMQLPYQGFSSDVCSLDYLRTCLKIQENIGELPAAIILETMQGETMDAVSDEWLISLQKICHQYKILLIVDDIQISCGRMTTFFSFEKSGIVPDIVLLSKAISGFGLPLSLVLLKPELDIWESGEHKGTFRGNSLTFLVANETLKYFWSDQDFIQSLTYKSNFLLAEIERIFRPVIDSISIKGKGLFYGIEFINKQSLALKVAKQSFTRGLLIDVCSAQDKILKIFPPITIEDIDITKGIEILYYSYMDIQ